MRKCLSLRCKRYVREDYIPEAVSQDYTDLGRIGYSMGGGGSVRAYGQHRNAARSTDLGAPICMGCVYSTKCCTYYCCWQRISDYFTEEEVPIQHSAGNLYPLYTMICTTY